MGILAGILLLICLHHIDGAEQDSSQERDYMEPLKYMCGAFAEPFLQCYEISKLREAFSARVAEAQLLQEAEADYRKDLLDYMDAHLSVLSPYLPEVKSFLASMDQAFVSYPGMRYQTCVKPSLAFRWDKDANLGALHKISIIGDMAAYFDGLVCEKGVLEAKAVGPSIAWPEVLKHASNFVPTPDMWWCRADGDDVALEKMCDDYSLRRGVLQDRRGLKLKCLRVPSEDFSHLALYHAMTQECLLLCLPKIQEGFSRDLLKNVSQHLRDQIVCMQSTLECHAKWSKMFPQDWPPFANVWGVVWTHMANYNHKQLAQMFFTLFYVLDSNIDPFCKENFESLRSLFTKGCRYYLGESYVSGINNLDSDATKDTGDNIACAHRNLARWLQQYILPVIDALKDQYCFNATAEIRLLQTEWSLPSQTVKLYDVYKKVFQKIFIQHGVGAEMQQVLLENNGGVEYPYFQALSSHQAVIRCCVWECDTFLVLPRHENNAALLFIPHKDYILQKPLISKHLIQRCCEGYLEVFETACEYTSFNYTPSNVL